MMFGGQKTHSDDDDRGDFREWRRAFLEKFESFEKGLYGIHTSHLAALEKIEGEQSNARNDREQLRQDLEGVRRDLAILGTKFELLTQEVKKKTGPLPQLPAANGSNGDGKKRLTEAITEEVKGKWQVYLLLAGFAINLFFEWYRAIPKP